VTVFFDVQGVQSPAHGERGVARYLTELAKALERRRPGLVSRFLLNADLAIPGTIEPLVATNRFAFNDRFDPVEGRVYHVGSPFEYVPIDRLWPPAARAAGLRLVVTLYDLIPELFPEIYLTDAGVLSWYRTRLGLVRRADRVLAISRASAKDAVERLGLSPERVVVVGAGVSERFHPPADHAAALAGLRTGRPAIEPGYLLYTGGIEPRKNIDRLLEAYAALPRELRERHQLVVICRVLPAERAVLARKLRRLGIAKRVLFPGYVRDEELLLLYQAAELFVFPSLYEGYGLPVAEAMASGAPVIASRTSSLLELVHDDEALFDPLETESIQATLERALSDKGLRARLRRATLDDSHTWDAVADRTAGVYDELAALPRPPRRRRRRIAFVTPLPPIRSGIADYSYRTLADLVRHCDVDAFVDHELIAEIEAPPGVVLERLRLFDLAERARGGYDEVVFALGNSEHHAAALALLRRRRGVVLAHDVRLTGLYWWCSRIRPDIEPRAFRHLLAETYGYRIPPELGLEGPLEYEPADRYGVYLAREAIALSTKFLVHSRYAAQIARLDAAPGDDAKVQVLDFGCPDPGEFPSVPTERPVIGTFGLVADVKQIPKVIEAFALVARTDPGPVLAIVGPPVGEAEQRRYLAQAERLGIADRVELTGGLPDAEFRARVGSATLAVQLRSVSNGESAGSVADCLAAGVPIVATALGGVRELPDEAVVKVERGVSAEELAGILAALLRDPGRRDALSRAGRAYARAHSFARVADDLYELLFGELAEAGSAAAA
jgi:glycosyltransferase involved in cell wall biosynthesis